MVRALASLASTLAMGTAAAQSAGPDLTIEAASDIRARGLSWTDGRAAARAFVDVPVTDGVGVSAAAASLRGSARHGGADLGLDLGAGWHGDHGPWRLSGGATAHVFAGRSHLNYAEGEAGASYLLGPVSVGLTGSYAPRQAAIGGDNLHLALGLDAGIPGTPFTLDGSVGHSSGSRSGRHAERAARLRPDGNYWDYRLGATYVRGRHALSLRLTGTSIDSRRPASTYDDGHVGTRLTAAWQLQL
jgi:uncharacterized protein (TIGR02001 family)